LHYHHDKYVVVPEDKASNNIIFACKSYYYKCLSKEVGISKKSGNPTCKDTSFDKKKFWQITSDQ
jgi:hypothetical protein